MGRLGGKVALITGAQQGIGKAIALAFGQEGASVVVNYLDDHSAAEHLAESIRQMGSRAVIVSGDVTQSNDVANMIEAGAELGGIDVLVNNAGIFPRVDFLKMSEAEWDQVFDVNLKGAFRCTQAVARTLIAQERGGTVINLSSIVVQNGSPKGVHYASSKAGLVGFTRAVALELASYKIRVNAIAPGITDTAQPRYGMTEAEIEAAGQETPLGRIGTPEDMANLAVFLASEESNYITGQTIHINGGKFLG